MNPSLRLMLLAAINVAGMSQAVAGVWRQWEIRIRLLGPVGGFTGTSFAGRMSGNGVTCIVTGLGGVAPGG